MAPAVLWRTFWVSFAAFVVGAVALSSWFGLALFASVWLLSPIILGVAQSFAADKSSERRIALTWWSIGLVAYVLASFATFVGAAVTLSPWLGLALFVSVLLLSPIILGVAQAFAAAKPSELRIALTWWSICLVAVGLETYFWYRLITR